MIIGAEDKVETKADFKLMGIMIAPERAALTPRTLCRYSGKYIAAPNTAIFASDEATTEAVKTRSLKKCSESRGSFDFLSMRRKTANMIAENTKSPAINGERSGRVPA